MWIQNNLSDDDIGRGAALAPNPPPATLVAGSYLAHLEAIVIFVEDYMTPVARGILAPQPRENVLSGLFYRAFGFCRSAVELKSYVHHGSLVPAERSVIELYLDMELISRNEVPDAIDRFFAFTNWQKLKRELQCVKVTNRKGLEDAACECYPADRHPPNRVPHPLSVATFEPVTSLAAPSNALRARISAWTRCPGRRRPRVRDFQCRAEGYNVLDCQLFGAGTS